MKYQTTATVSVTSANQYVDMLGKHFSRKVKVTREAQTATVFFVMGVCKMQAIDDKLSFICQAQDGEGLKETQEVIDRHLPMMKALRDTKLDWKTLAI